MEAKREASRKIHKIQQEFRDDSIRVGYVTMNTTSKYWENFEEEINKEEDIEFVEVEKPIYFKITDKQYIFDINNSRKLKKHLEHGLNQILESAESLIETINELNLKTANTDAERLFIERNIKLRELLVLSGKVK